MREERIVAEAITMANLVTGRDTAASTGQSKYVVYRI